MSSLKLTLEEVLANKRREDQARLDAEFLARAEQVRVLQGLTMQCSSTVCPHCGKSILAKGQVMVDEEDTRI